MNITECVPLAGRGLVARRGHLVALTGGTDAGPDPLLTALTAVAYANGDGAALVLAGTRAAAEHGGRPAWACAGVTFGGEVAVLVHGEAVALVSVDGSPEAQVTASGSMIPVVGTFTGAVVTVRLVIGPPAPPDPRLWLEAGTVFGGGIVLTIKQEKPSNLIPNDPYASVAATMRPAMEQAVGNMVLHPSAAGPAVPAVPAPPGVAPGEVYPEDVLRLRRGARNADLARPMSSVVIDVGTRRSACSAVERVARRESGRDLPPLVARHLVGHAVEASLHGEADWHVDDVVPGLQSGQRGRRAQRCDG